MWTCKFAKNLGRVAAVGSMSAGALWATIATPQSMSIAFCDNSTEDGVRAKLRKTATILKAGTANTTKRFDTKKELGKIRKDEKEMLLRWERDEDGWRDLPARAWPAYQPNPEELPGIENELASNDCHTERSKTDTCQKLRFNVATALVFNTMDPQIGFESFEKLANEGHVDSMVACGVILVEGLGGVPPREEEGMRWLEKAIKLNSMQACYELGTVYYTGIDGVVEEDPVTAFQLFERAAAVGHNGALYMMADCLIEGEGTDVDVARAIPLLYRAADNGHRFARQRIRELLADKQYKS